MPIMDGLKTVSILKAEMEQGTIDYGICIANTGFVDLETKMKCFEMGMDFYISKPIKRLDLHDYINSKFKII
jgi:CheY-like chemotaxis protein